DYINSHQLFFALGVLLVGLGVTTVTAPARLDLVAPAVNDTIPYDLGAPFLYPFLFITIACGAISGFHCMVASGTTARQLNTERDARAIGYGAMILEGGLAVIVIICCCSAAGFPDVAAWNAKYSTAWAGQGGLLTKLQGFIQGGAGYMHAAVPFFGVSLLEAVMAVVIISFAATTMDSATRIQRYVITELGDAIGAPALRRKHVATTIAVVSAAALAMFAGKGGSGGLILWPVFGVMNQLLACLTFLILNTWLAKRGKPVLFTTIPMLFLVVTVSWAGISLFGRFARDAAANWHLLFVLSIGLVLEGWMIVEGVSVYLLSRRVRRERMEPDRARLALAGPSGAVIDEHGIVQDPGATGSFPERDVF
ncbi:MAG: carbon starvation protein A, partial [Planctomycetota bacterium]|nr:carbon starvation protein A [Planctomycetota bacterium]